MEFDTDGPAQNEPSLGHFLKSLKVQFNTWSQAPARPIKGSLILATLTPHYAASIFQLKDEHEST
jgi:hypothetical protein